MGSVVKTVVGVALIAVAVFVPGAQFLLTAGISLTMSGLTGMLASKKPKTNSASAARLSKSLDPEAFRKIVLGKTAAGADLRYWEIYGSGDKQYDEVIAAAGHEIHSFDAFYLESAQVTFSGGMSGGATGTYAGVLSIETNNGHVGNAALAVGAGGAWTAASKFRGSAHYALRWVYDQNKLPQGIPSRYTCVVEGALLYDPRKDSTVGGSGTHRYNDQSTWEYAPLDSNGVPIGRNNALQVLWYLLGWRISDTSGNPVLVAGRGVDPVDVDFSSFITAANDCEALKLYTDCVLSTGDPHQTNESILTGDGAIGTLVDPGGMWTYFVNKNDTASVDVALSDDDVVDTGTVEWAPKLPLSDQYNRVVGSFIDPSSTSLYQAQPYPQAVSTAFEASDGFKKRKTVNYQAIQDGQLAQYVSTLVLNESRWQGQFTAKFNYRALATRLYGVVSLTLERYGFSAKKFRVLSMLVEADGVTLRLGEVDASIWTTGAPGTVNPSAGGSNGSTGGVVPLTGVSVAAIAISSAGATYPGLRVSWSPVPSTVRYVQVRYRKSGDATWRTGGLADGTATSLDLYDLEANITYEVETQTVSTFGVLSGWSAAISQGTGTSVTPPALLSPIASANLRYKFSGAITYSCDTSSATISVAAGNLVLGSTTVAYNAMSTSITGLTAGSTHTWYLYVNANAYTAGAHTLLATENSDDIYGNDANVYIGTVGPVTLPTSGTGGGSGTGGTGYCVHEWAWAETARGIIPAREVVPGDRLLVLSEDRERLEWAVCEENDPGLEHCYLIRSRASGHAITCSQTTPLTLRDGSHIFPADVAGHELPLCEGGRLWWEECDAVHVGLRVVRKTRVHQKVFAAGDEPGRSILTHNLVQAKP